MAESRYNGERSQSPERIVTGRIALATLAVAAMAAAPPVTRPLRADPESLARASPDLLTDLKADAFTYFRFVNRQWIARVCEAFDDVPDMPIVRLHGDAHLEQFAVTKDAWGLDDFDDSARGPAAIDVVRFLGSVDLVARKRGWTKEREALFTRFFEGYRRGLADPTYRPPRPEVVGRLRARLPAATRAAFLKWGERQMHPMTESSADAVIGGMEAFSDLLRRDHPDLPPGYFRVVRAGWLRMGVGSNEDVKVLIRVQGASADPADDELLEAKQLRSLAGLRCLEEPASQPTTRIIAGVHQMGRLNYRILASGPDLVIPDLLVVGTPIGDWWIRSWDPSYREIRLGDFHSARDLDAVVYDSGVQLGAGALHEATGLQSEALREREVTSIGTLEARLRRETVELVDDLLGGWHELRGR
jgi:uncharacterized protein DUF2252